MRILFVQHDMLVWASARAWAYTSHMAFVEGLRALGHEVEVILTACWPAAREQVGGRRFDQVWINDVTHVLCRRPAAEAPPPLGEADFAWLASLAPVRIGIVMETLHYTAAEYAELPELAERVPLMRRCVLPHVTHLCVVDEADVPAMEGLGVPTLWIPCHVPRRFFRTSLVDATLPAVFIGNAYARRAKYAHSAALRGLLEFRVSPEHATALPSVFDQLHGELRPALLAQPFVAEDHHRFVDMAHRVRAGLFERFLDGVEASSACVNLPSFVRAYAGRVIESMVVGRPVVSWRVPDRPMTERLFRDGETIVLFDGDDPEALARQLHRLRSEPGLALRIGTASRANALRHHRSEHRMGQIEAWARSGTMPTYWN